jgi:serine protease
VKYKDDTVQSISAFSGSTKTAALAKKSGAALSYQRQMSGVTHILGLQKSLPRSEAVALSKRLEMDSNVEYAEPDDWVYPSLVPNDPSYSTRQWNLYAPDTTTGNLGGANLPDAWDISRGQGATVAVIDTGIVVHPEIGINVVGGYDFISDIVRANEGAGGDGRDSNPSDPGDWQSASDCSASPVQANSSWHGTYVAGLIGALTNNFVAGAGIAYEARVVPLRALGRCGGLSSDIVDAIRWAAGLAVPGVPRNPNAAQVINMSLGSPNACSPAYQSAIDEVRAIGAVVVAATGNNDDIVIDRPANCQGVIAVTAHTFQGDKAKYANFGPGTTISAPGGGACSTQDGPTFTCLTAVSSATGARVWSDVLFGITTPTSSGIAGGSGPAFGGYVGTSAAAPHVAGVAALLLSRMPTLVPDEVSFLLTSSARPHPAALFCAQSGVGTCGSGLLDATAALTRLTDRTPMVVSSASSPIVTGGQTTTLTAVATPRNGGNSSFTYMWAQTAGPIVTLNNATTGMPSFTASNPGGTHSFTVTVRDGNGYQVTQAVSVRSNNAATIAPVANVSVIQGSSVTVNVAATDPENDVLTYVATNLPAGSTFSAASGQFSWSNVAAALDTYTFNVVANDGTVNSASVAVNVTVAAAPPPAPPSHGGGTFTLKQLFVLSLVGLLTIFRKRRLTADNTR